MQSEEFVRCDKDEVWRDTLN